MLTSPDCSRPSLPRRPACMQLACVMLQTRLLTASHISHAAACQQARTPPTHTHTRVSHRCALTRPRRVAADGGPLANIQRQDHDLLSREPRRLREMEVERLELALSGVNL